jgi:hypothetical protein
VVPGMGPCGEQDELLSDSHCPSQKVDPIKQHHWSTFNRVQPPLRLMTTSNNRF